MTDRDLPITEYPLSEPWFQPYRSMVMWTEGHTLESIVEGGIPGFPLWRYRAVGSQIALIADLHYRNMLTPTKENQ